MYIPPAPATSTDPIISRLRPRTVGEVVDQSFRLYRKYFLTFLAIAAVVYVPVNIIVQGLNVLLQGGNAQLQQQLLEDPYSTNIQQTSNQVLMSTLVLSGVLIVIGVIGGLLQQISEGALTSAVADSYLDKPVSFGGAYQEVRKHIGSLIGAIVLQVLVYVAIFSPLLLLAIPLAIGLASPGSFGSDSSVGILCLVYCLFFPAIIAVYYVVIRYTVVVPAIIVENLGAVAALRRSWRLVQNYWWRTLGLIILLGILSAIITAGPAALVLGIVTLVTGRLDPVVSSIVTGVFTVLTGMIFIPLQLTAITLYYFDLRVRKEGFDIETAMSRSFGAPPPPPPTYDYGQYGQQPYNQGGMAPPALGYSPDPAQSQGYGAPTQPVYQPPTPGPTSEQVEPGVPAADLGYVPPASDVSYTPPQEESSPYSEPYTSGGTSPSETPSATENPASREVDYGQNTAPTPDWLSSPGNTGSPASAEPEMPAPDGEDKPNPYSAPPEREQS